MKMKINLNEQRIREKVTNDRFGRFVANEWKRLINPYTPKDTGLMIQTATIHPFEIHYIQPYSKYAYEGKRSVDPLTGKAGFLADGGWFSRPGVQKVPSGKPLDYQKNNAYTTDHWDEKAAAGGQLNKLYRTINNGLKSGHF